MSRDRRSDGARAGRAHARAFGGSTGSAPTCSAATSIRACIYGARVSLTVGFSVALLASRRRPRHRPGLRLRAMGGRHHHAGHGRADVDPADPAGHRADGADARRASATSSSPSPSPRSRACRGWCAASCCRCASSPMSMRPRPPARATPMIILRHILPNTLAPLTGAGDLYLRQRDDHGGDPVLHRRRHAADHSVLGQHHGRGPGALAGQALHRVLSRRVPVGHRAGRQPARRRAARCARSATGQAVCPMALLEVDNLQTHFRTPDGINRAVDGVSFHVDAGETLAIVGESGCGKSVTAMSILRLIPEPPGKIAGSIRFQGTDLLKLSEREMRSDPRQRHRDDLPGADDEPQPGADRRPADRRDAAAAPGARQAGRPRRAPSRC